ncbi:MAG: HDOD domain-containing protein [Thermodesulfobacteriota bacterium]|nr:HDOD domain-containing protein [Thermodesulfobacteriota bacterium]
MISDKILKSINNLPAFPTTVHRVSKVINDPDFSVPDLVNVIKYDQSITANILRMCNSPYFGIRYKVNSLREAVVYLGRQNILHVVYAAGTSRYYKKVKGYYWEATKLWEHSVGVALMSQILDKKIYNRENSELFTAGLLHDIGKVVLGEFVHESFQEIMDLVSNHGYSFLEAENEVIGIDHAELGGKIASLWNFPKGIKDAITYHHRPDLMEKGDDSIPWLIYLADQACMMMGIGGGADGLAYRGLEEVINKFGLRQRDFEESIVLLLKDLDEAKELLNLVDNK